MDLKTKRAVVAFVERMWNPSVKLAMTMKSGATEAQIERELATKYGEIADMMRKELKKEGSEERCEPCERAAEIAREAFKEAIREVGGGNLTEERKEEVRRKIKERVKENLGLEL
ncbi:unnamed protein product [marine sediment metagenome]|uniref:Uncharacterized protein n=1 Tax=marine sediment metagenome TaxID=412755 RepID=X1P4M3_9ZZZZ